MDHQASTRPSIAKSPSLAGMSVLFCTAAGARVDLTVIDLPGIIHSVGNSQDTQCKDLIRDTVLDYISSSQAVIVAVISCKDEPDNQVQP